MTRTILAVVAALTALAIATPSHATLNACAAAKKLCVAKKAAALLKCHSKHEKPPLGSDPTKFASCLQKAKDKFDGGAHPEKGCFAKLETKFGPGGCLSTNDVTTLEATVDAFVDEVICQLDPSEGTCPATPIPSPTSTPACLGIGQGCATNSQCCSLSCMAGQCQPSCSNGMQDGNETGIDCGGGTCPACALGGGCASNTDCVATTVCSGGQCVCAGGLSNCDGNPNDGCETNTSNDVVNCGSCNVVCTAQNATPGCMGGQCTIGACSPGFADCDAMSGNGCEVNTNGDLNNCGGCNLACSPPPNATPGCMGGQCTIGTCNPGFRNCDGMTPNGCEVNSNTDHNNCGLCGVLCGMAQTCVGGVCQ